jgi:hypothetical protein
LHRGDLDFVVFWFGKPEDAQAFAERFGGELPNFLASDDALGRHHIER